MLEKAKVWIEANKGTVILIAAVIIILGFFGFKNGGFLRRIFRGRGRAGR